MLHHEQNKLYLIPFYRYALTLFQSEGGMDPSSHFNFFYFTQKVVKLVNQNFVTFPKIYLATFIINNFEKFCINEAFRGQRSAADIFKKLKALDILLVIYHWKVFSSLIKKKRHEKL